ncbi:hypothetical protein ABFT23_07960 [Nocardioides sp. C4-1]|uniref:hypothetical protein n=1 Tax=Nocardioides sp. C4-1 TaxID=3151851 RepID=UPI0032634CA8
MGDEDDERGRGSRVPPIAVPGALFVVLSFVTRDVWALYAGGALLALASLQWTRR